MKRFHRSLSLIALVAWLVCAAGTALAATGDMWEVTSQMTMEGMPPGMGMPAQTRRVCSTKEWTKPPVAQDDRSCQTTDFKGSATKVNWKMKCDGMTGEGEINRTSPDAYTGWMKMTMSEGTMTMNLSGRRVGDCDAGEAKKERDAQVARIETQLAQGQKAADDAQKQTCAAPANTLDLRQFQSYATFCTGPSYKAGFCDKVKSYDGFKILCKRDPADTENSFVAVAKFCSADAQALTRAACPQAVKTNDLDTVGRCCPVEAQALAAAHCAGRQYTSARDDGYGAFCGRFAKDLLGH